mgnify:FL=1
MSKRIVVAYYPASYLRDNPVYSMEIIDSSMSAPEWLDYMRRKSGVSDLKLCITGADEWVAPKPEKLKWEYRYELRELDD